LCTLGWLILVRWRTGRHRAALWKSLVLPAAGTTLCWSLLMTLWLPLLNHGRSYAPLMAKVSAVTGTSPCVQAFGLQNAQVAALIVHGKWQVRAAGEAREDCRWLVTDSHALPSQAERLQAWGWHEVTRIRRPADPDETLVIFKAGTP
jgi:hypothetical protein